MTGVDTAYQHGFHLNGNGLHDVPHRNSVPCLMLSGAFCCEYLRFKNLSFHSSFSSHILPSPTGSGGSILDCFAVNREESHGTGTSCSLDGKRRMYKDMVGGACSGQRSWVKKKENHNTYTSVLVFWMNIQF